MNKSLRTFRSKFNFPNKSVLQWFPGHMSKGMKQIEQKLKNVDCLIEVHDARIPFSGRNIKFKYLYEAKPHILVFNKKDLIDMSNTNEIISELKDVSKVIYTNCKDQNCIGLKQIIPTTIELISNSNRYNRSEEEDYSIMVLGVPNVGKSSLINILRNKYLKQSKATMVGPTAGVTKSVMTKIKICNKPQVYLLDTPGLKEPSDIILEVLTLTAVNLNKNVKRRNIVDGGIQMHPDLDAAAYHFINAFRRGELGKIMLD
ncbi:hypothetical protein O3M35_002063 [Rhynocoris fuscipes]|uniref:Mitochondrial GTPase 1 n=1 Tax=Rhynocoris fuscipes TaxID=488301 RepID=A0AAW1CWA0_9HEMI